MRKNTKRMGVALLGALFLILCLGITSALADGTSSIEGSSFVAGTSQMEESLASISRQVRAADVTPDSAIDLSQTLITMPGEYNVTSSDIIELIGLGKVYEVTGTTTTYSIKAKADCTILLNGVDIQLSSTRFPIDLQNQMVTMTLEDNTINTVKTTATNYAGIFTDNGTLTINGSGKLIAAGGTYGAGIGGRNYTVWGTINISGDAQVEAMGGTVVQGSVEEFIV